MCAGAMLQARIKRLVYGADDEKAGVINSLYKLVEDNRFNHTITVKSGVLAEKSIKLMQDFFRKLRKNC